MGFAERILDRQIEHGSGSADERLHAAARSNRIALAAMVLQGLVIGLNVPGQDGAWRTGWMVLGVAWLLYAFVVIRQRRYLRTLKQDADPGRDSPP